MMIIIRTSPPLLPLCNHVLIVPSLPLLLALSHYILSSCCDRYHNTGRDAGNGIQDLWRLDLDTFVWEQLTEENAPPPVLDSPLAMVGDMLLRWDTVAGELHTLHLTPNSKNKYEWQQDIEYTGDAPVTGRNHVDSVVWKDNYWIIWGAWGGSSMEVYQYDMLLHTFTKLELTGTVPPTRAKSAHVVRTRVSLCCCHYCLAITTIAMKIVLTEPCSPATF